MSNNDKNALHNAGEIIERFGGIRPMAAKIDAPVTTVQGWKKRDVIPGTRREQILSAAQDNNIDISDLAGKATITNDNTVSEKKAAVKKAKPKAQAYPTSVPKASPAQATQAQAPSATKGPQHDNLIAAIEENSRKTMAASAWITTGLVLLALGAAGFLLWPSMQEKNELIETQAEKIAALEDEVDDVSARTSFIKNIVPDNIQEKMDTLQTQAQNIQNTVQQLSDRADEISSGVLGADAGPLSERLRVLEEQMASLSSDGNNFGDLIARIKTLEASIPGQAQLQNSVEELRTMVEQKEEGVSLNEELAEAQSEEEGALSQTLEGVSGNDLKAAAMLIAFSQLRDSLNREEPFENDLALLEKLAGEDNPELQVALDRLAPHADGGILTAKGLSGEFKGLAGDIVVSSLKGEDISFKEKAKARLSNILQVEKDGELVGGTETQVTVAKAQKMLDAGDIQGAISELQKLDGEAAQTAQPFIEQAQISLLSEKVQQMIGEDILSKISGQLPIQGMLKGTAIEGLMPNVSADNTPAMQESGQVKEKDNWSSFDMNDVKKNLENAVPAMGEDREVVRDEESGVTILPSQPGFKGFSGGNNLP